MLQYEKIDVSEGIDLHKTGKSKNVKFVITTISTMVLNLNRKLVMIIYSGITSFGLENFAIINVKGVGYRLFMFDMTQDDMHNILGDFESDEL